MLTTVAVSAASVHTSASNEVIFASSSGTLRDPDNFAGPGARPATNSGCPMSRSHSFRKTVATLMTMPDCRRGSGPTTGHAKVSMTQDRYMSRGRVHTQVADLLDRAVADINDE